MVGNNLLFSSAPVCRTNRRYIWYALLPYGVCRLFCVWFLYQTFSAKNVFDYDGRTISGSIPDCFHCKEIWSRILGRFFWLFMYYDSRTDYRDFPVCFKSRPPSCVNNAFWIKMLTSFSNCSFGVYLIHKLIMVDIIRKMEVFGSLNVYALILLSIITTAFVAWLFVFTISFIPHSEYIVGFRNKK